MLRRPASRAASRVLPAQAMSSQPKPPPASRRIPEPQPLTQSVGTAAIEIAETAGGMAILLGKVIARTVTLRIDGAELLRSLYNMGVRSMPIVLVPPLFTGALMIPHAGPEQIDALRVLAIDPISFLVAPRSIAMVTTLFLATVFADVLALVGAAYAGQALLGVPPMMFYNGLTSGLLGIGDVVAGLVKSVVFGIVMALASCQYGLAVKGGAPGVGRAVNATVVASAAGIFVLDYFVSFLLG